MSELNRMLSDLSSPQNSEKRATVSPVPSAWGYRFARVVLALVATLLSATGIAWAVSVGTASVSSQALAPLPVAAESKLPVAKAALPSPTQKVISQDVSYVAMNTAASVKVADPAVTKPSPAVNASSETAAKPVVKAESKAESKAEPKTMQIAAVSKPVPAVTLEVDEPASMSVETIELSGEELAALSYEKAQKRAQVGDTQTAIKHLRDAVKYDPNHVVATNQLAGLLYGRSQLRDAESVLRKGIKANPYSATLKLTLARMYQQSGSEESALNVLAVPVESLDGEQVRFVAMRAALAQKLGNNQEAKNSYQWLTDVEPMDGRWWLGLGVSAEKIEAFAEAEKAYARAVRSGGLSNESVNFARQRLAYLQNLKQGATDGR